MSDRKNPLDEFDPNDTGAPWASYCPGRRSHGASKLRVHRMRAHALAAIGNHSSYSGGILFESQDGKWVEVVRFQPHEFVPEVCTNCNQSTMEVKMVRNPAYRWTAGAYNATPINIPDPSGTLVNMGKQVLERRGGAGGKLVEPLRVLTLCAPCRSALRY